MLKPKLKTLFTKPLATAWKILSVLFGALGIAFGIWQYLEESETREQLDKTIQSLEYAEQRAQKALVEIEKMQGVIREYEVQKAGVNHERDSLLGVWKDYLMELQKKI